MTYICPKCLEPVELKGSKEGIHGGTCTKCQTWWGKQQLETTEQCKQ